MTPESVGWDAEQFPFSAQSGRHGLQKRLAILGYAVAENSLSDAYDRFLQVATEKVLVRDTDLHMLMLG